MNDNEKINRQVVEEIKGILEKHNISEYVIMGCKGKEGFFLTGSDPVKLAKLLMHESADAFVLLNQIVDAGNKSCEAIFDSRITNAILH